MFLKKIADLFLIIFPGSLDAAYVDKINSIIIKLLKINTITLMILLLVFSFNNEDIFIKYFNTSLVLIYSIFYIYVLFTIMYTRSKDCLRIPCTMECRTGPYMFYFKLKKLIHISKIINPISIVLSGIIMLLIFL